MLFSLLSLLSFTTQGKELKSLTSLRRKKVKIYLHVIVKYSLSGSLCTINTLFSCQKKAACNSNRFELSGVEKARTRQKEGRGDKSCKRCSSPPQKKTKKSTKGIGALFDWKLWNQNQIITMANQKKGKYPEEPMRTQNKTKSLQWPIRRKENTLKSQWELKMKPTNLSKARENSTDQVVIGFSFASDWLREWREFFWSNHWGK